MDDVNKILEQLSELKASFGAFAVLIFILLFLSVFFLAKYLLKRIEKSAEISSGKNLEKFKNSLEKELEEYSLRLSLTYQRQGKAIEEVYTKLAKLVSWLNFLIKGDKFQEQKEPIKDLEILIQYRRELIGTYELYKIYFPKLLNEKIEALFPVLDDFMEQYNSGLISNNSDTLLFSDGKDNFVLAGIWNQKEFNEVLIKFSTVKDEVEDIFRTVVGI